MAAPTPQTRLNYSDLRYNGTTPTQVRFNGTTLSRLQWNGVDKIHQEVQSTIQRCGQPMFCYSTSAWAEVWWDPCGPEWVITWTFASACAYNCEYDCRPAFYVTACRGTVNCCNFSPTCWRSSDNNPYFEIGYYSSDLSSVGLTGVVFNLNTCSTGNKNMSCTGHNMFAACAMCFASYNNACWYGTTCRVYDSVNRVCYTACICYKYDYLGLDTDDDPVPGIYNEKYNGWQQTFLNNSSQTLNVYTPSLEYCTCQQRRIAIVCPRQGCNGWPVKQSLSFRVGYDLCGCAWLGCRNY